MKLLCTRLLVALLAAMVLTSPVLAQVDVAARGMAAQAREATTDRFAGFTLPSNRVKRIAILGDSFVGGAGTAPGDNPLTFAVPLSAALRAKYGDAGSGYVAWTNGKMASVNATGWTYAGAISAGSSFRLWSPPDRGLAFSGLGLFVAGGTGYGENKSISYTPNVADSFVRGSVDTNSFARVHFMFRSANAGFIIRQSDKNPAFEPTMIVSSGASFTASISGTTMTVTGTPTGLLAKGAEVFGTGITAGTIIVSAGGGGGAGSYTLNVSHSLSSATFTTGPNVDPTVNRPQSIGYRYDPTGNQSLQILYAYGDVHVAGVETYNGLAGVTLTDMGQGGTTAMQWGSLDEAAQRAWWQNAPFDQVIVVLGMNDRTSISPTSYGAAIARIVARIQANPRAKVLLVYQTDPADAASSYFRYYGDVLRSIAAGMGTGFFDEHSCPGFADYATAVAAGYMLDGVHRNGPGNTAMAACYASRVKIGFGLDLPRLPANDHAAEAAA